FTDALVAQTGFVQRFARGGPRVFRSLPKVTAQFALRRVEIAGIGRRGHAAAHAQGGEVGHVAKTGTARAQAIEQGMAVGAEAGDRAHASDDDPPHQSRALKISEVLMPPNAKLLFITYP